MRPPRSTPLALLCLLCATLAALPVAAQQEGSPPDEAGGPTIEVPILGEIPVPGFLAGLLGLERGGPEGAAQAQGGSRPPAVVFQRAETRPVGDSFRFLGRVTPIERVEVQARVSGFIEEVAFEGGEFVERGDLLFQIQREQYEIAVAAARARLDSAEAANAETRRQLERQRELRESNTVSQANLDDAISAAEAARAEVRQAETELRQAELDLGYTSIEAAIDGKMSAPLITRGNYVSGASGTLAELVQLDPIWGVFSLGENRLSRWRQLGIGTGEVAPIGRDGSSGRAGTGTGRSDAEAAENYRLRLVLPDGSIYAEEGEFAFVGNTVDAETGTVEVRVRFANPDGLLLPNQNVTLRVEEADPPVLPVIRQSAIQLGREGRAVWVVNEDDTVARMPVEVAPGPEPGTVAVTRGLTGGERVIVRGALRLEEGQTVDPRTAGGQGGLPGGGASGGAGGSGQGSGGSGGSQ